MKDKIPRLELGEHIFAIQNEDGNIELYSTLDEPVRDSEGDGTIYELYVYRQIDIKQSA